MGISIVVISGGNQGRSKAFDANQQEITFGRGDGADVQLHATDTSCSRGIHARLSRVGEEWFIQAEHENGIVVQDDGMESIVKAGERRKVDPPAVVRLGKSGPKLAIGHTERSDLTVMRGAPRDRGEGAAAWSARTDATVQWSGGKVDAAAPAPPISLQPLFTKNHEVLIGREADCDFRLSHPTVSSRHAVLSKSDGKVFIRDLGSLNGTFVKGVRIRRTTPLFSGDRFGIGPLLFLLEGDAIRTIDIAASLRMEARGLEQIVPEGRRKTKVILRDIHLVIEPSEFVALLGPSGCGKSTLMNCLNGRVRASGGKVIANGVDFYENFDQFRQSLGYVPQKDIVHAQLTVYRALYYTARLRLPRDMSPLEIEKRIEEVLKDMELVEHRNTLIANLSGGQIKRVSLGVELLASPSMLFIDEATSGLDAGIETKMMNLFRRLADAGRSVVCITHNVDNVVESCHMVVILAAGRLIFFGPPAEAPGYFNVTRLGQIYTRLADKPPEQWEAEFRNSEFHAQYVAARLSKLPTSSPESVVAVTPTLSLRPDTNAKSVLQQGVETIEMEQTPVRESLPATRGDSSAFNVGNAKPQSCPVSRFPKIKPIWTKSVRSWFQFRVLTRRYIQLTLRDARSLRLLLLQAPIVALCILIGLAHKPYREPEPQLRDMTAKERTALASLQKLSDSSRKAESIVDRVADPREAKSREALDAFHKFSGTQIPQAILNMNKLPTGKMVPSRRYTNILLMIMAIAIFWFGCNNAAKEIVKEHAIYSRERAVNLQVLPYLASKMVVLSMVAAIQTFLLMLFVYGVLMFLAAKFGHQFPYPDHFLPFGKQFILMTLLAAVGTAFGLALSASVTTPDRANALLPYVLIPQIVFGGLIPLEGHLVAVLAMVVSPVNWAFEGLRRIVPEWPRFGALLRTSDHPAWRACLGLSVQFVIFLIIASWLLKRKGGVGGMVRT